MKKATVTGGAGFIGSHVVDALVREGYSVRVIDNLSTGRTEYVSREAELVVADVTDGARMKELIKSPGVVFHLAGSISIPYSIEHPAETCRNNVEGTVNVLEAARAAGATRVVFISSAAVYGEQAVPASEEAHCAPLSPYGLEKLIGEEYCKLYSRIHGLSTAAIRPFNIYGPRQSAVSGALVPSLLVRAARAEPLIVTGSGEQLRDFVYVEDLAQALVGVGIADTPFLGEVFNVGSGSGTSVLELATLVSDAIEHTKARFEIKDSIANITKIKEAIGWHPKVGLEDGMRRTKEAFSRHVV